MIFGIEASNITGGGGLVHLKGILNNLDEAAINEDDTIYVWCNFHVSQALNKNKNIKIIYKKVFSYNFVFRFLWQAIFFPREARRLGCSVILVPGGTLLRKFVPYVVVSQNLLPFSKYERQRYYRYARGLKLLLLYFFQKRTFKNASKIIFLHEYAKKVISDCVTLTCESVVIPHGSPDMVLNYSLGAERNVRVSDKSGVLNITYVSTIDLYKHQDNVVLALDRVQQKYNFKLRLNLVGGYYPPALKKLQRTIETVDPGRSWVRLVGEVPQEEVFKCYSESDLCIFASTCENLPNVLIEMIGSSAVLVCSDRRPMSDLLGDYPFYFDPESITSIETAVRRAALFLRDGDTSLDGFKPRWSGLSWSNVSRSTFEVLRMAAEASLEE